MEGDDVGRVQEFVQFDEPDICFALHGERCRGFRRHERVMRDDLHPQGPGFHRHAPADVSQADQAQGLAPQTMYRQQFIGRPPVPFSPAHQPVRRRYLARGCKQQRQRVLRDFLQAEVRHVGHTEAQLGGGLEVHRVQADAGSNHPHRLIHLGEEFAGKANPTGDQDGGLTGQTQALLLVVYFRQAEHASGAADHLRIKTSKGVEIPLGPQDQTGSVLVLVRHTFLTV